MEKIKCKRCGKPEDEFHHIIPKYFGGTDKDGRVYLCKRCHDLIHQLIIELTINFLKKDDRLLPT